MRRTRAAVALLLASGWATASPRVAEACSCMLPSDAGQAYDASDVVFAGTATQAEYTVGTYGHAALMDVDTVWKGRVARQVLMVYGEFDPQEGQWSQSSCDNEMFVGVRMLVFGTRRDGYYTDWTCIGSDHWSDDHRPMLLDDLLARFGPGRSPNDSLPTHALPEPRGTPAPLLPWNAAQTTAQASDGRGYPPPEHPVRSAGPDRPATVVNPLEVGLLIALGVLGGGAAVAIALRRVKAGPGRSDDATR